MDEPNNTRAMELMDMMTALGMRQIVDFPTHNLLHTLDLIFIETGSLEDSCRCYPGAFISDHRIVNLNILKKQVPHPVKEVTFRKLKNIDYAVFKQDISEACANLSLHGLNVDNAVMNSETMVKRILDEHAPEKKIKVKLRKKECWFTEQIRDQRKVVRKREKIWRKYGEEHQWLAFKIERNYFKKMIREEKSTILKK